MQSGFYCSVVTDIELMPLQRRDWCDEDLEVDGRSEGLDAVVVGQGPKPSACFFRERVRSVSSIINSLGQRWKPAAREETAVITESQRSVSDNQPQHRALATRDTSGRSAVFVV